MSGVRKPCVSTCSTAASIRWAASSWFRLKRSIMAALRMVASGLATPLPAIWGTCRNWAALVLVAGRRQHADGTGEHGSFVAQDVAKHVAGDDHVEGLGRFRQLHGGVGHVHVGALDARATGAHFVMYLPDGHQHVGLVDMGDLRRAGARPGNGDQRCADLLFAVAHGVEALSSAPGGRRGEHRGGVPAEQMSRLSRG